MLVFVGRDSSPATDALVGLLCLADLEKPGESTRRSSGEPPHKIGIGMNALHACSATVIIRLSAEDLE
jgi:hypothetical protein